MSASAAPVSPATVTVADDPGARLAFSERTGVGNVSLLVGGGDPLHARTQLGGLVGLPASAAVFMQQAHGAGIAEVGRDERGRGLHRHDDAIADVDALITRDVDVALVVLVADCVPVLLVDPGRAVGAVHAGRRGVVAGVASATVRALTDAPARVTAVIGPAIGGCCYEVPATLVGEVAEALPPARARTRWGSPALDLPRAVTHQLEEAGVAQVHRLGGCTACHNERWFSHRADPAARVGRQAGVVCRRASAPAPDATVSRLPGVAHGVA